MKILTVSNLYPWPAQPQRGRFNAQLFAALGRLAAVENLCLVPEWRPWRWAGVRQWQQPPGAAGAPSSRYEPVAYIPKLGRDWSARTYAWSLQGWRERFGVCDVVYASWLYPDGAAVAALAREAGVDCWLMVLGSDVEHLMAPARRRAVLEACASARGLVCVAQHLADRLAECGVAVAKLHVVPNGVDAALFKPLARDSARAALSAQWRDLPWADAPDAPVAIFVGNLVPVKAPDLLLRAWAAVMAAAHRGGVRRPALVIVGDGPLRARLEQSLPAACRASVRFVGARPHAELALWLNAADCLCLCSRSEGMPNVVLEAQACGLPVVATDAGACRALLADDPGSRLVAAPAPDALGDALQAALAAGLADGRTPRVVRVRRGSWDDQARRILELMAGA